MDRDVFLDHLLRATERSREFATRYVLDSLPRAYAFWVLLNRSGNLNPLVNGVVVFPGDLQKHGERVGPLIADDVVSLLWRDRMVPEWTDISVWEADERVTYFELLCCGRFTADSQRLYYHWTDVAPFGVKSPVYPAGTAIAAWQRGDPPIEKFRLAESRRTALLARRNRVTE